VSPARGGIQTDRGDIVARAKRTERAEARRRYRAALAEAGHEHEEEEPAEPNGTDRSTATRPSRSAAAAEPPVRPSLRRAFAESFHSPNIREDIATLPWLTLRTKAIWLPSLLSVLAAASLFSFGLNEWTFLIFQYFAYILPVGALFLAGFLAPKASYVAGAVVGLVATAVFAVTLFSGVLDEANEAFRDPEQRVGLILQGLFTSTLGGAFVASAAAWYKRFLHLANPNRGRRPPPRRTSGSNRPAARRR
jgi:hypothetical protein